MEFTTRPCSTWAWSTAWPSIGEVPFPQTPVVPLLLWRPGCDQWLGEAGQSSRTGKMEELPWMNLMAEGLFFLVESSLLQKGQVQAIIRNFPGAVAGFSKLCFLGSKLLVKETCLDIIVSNMTSE